MRLIASASEEEMVLAFLQAEFRSPRFKSDVRRLLGGDADLLYRPRLNDNVENEKRKQVLAAYRGFGRDDALFRGFPTSVEWNRLTLGPDEIGEMLYANYRTWVDLSGGTRLVRDGAANVGLVEVGENANENILAVERDVRSGRTFPELIAAASSAEDTHVLVEGHSRATAYVRAADFDAEFEVIAAHSPAVAEWVFF
jgi:hypothetical protein